MAGEVNVLDVTFLNTQNQNIQPYAPLVVDTTNSTTIQTGAMLPTAAGQLPIGVADDKAKLDQYGNVVSGQGIACRVLGLFKCYASGAITAGSMVSIDSSGNWVETLNGSVVASGGVSTPTVKAQAQTAGGSQPVPIVGRALTAAQNAGDRIVVDLMIGATY